MADQFADHVLRPGVPWGSLWKAQTFIDCFNLDGRYSVTAHAANIRCPTLFIFGSEECAVVEPQELPVWGEAQRDIESSRYPHVMVKIIDVANHGYMNRHEELRSTIFSWLRKLNN